MFKKVWIGFAGGMITGLFASGGGMILVPCLMYFLRMEDKIARATAAFCILPWVILSSFFYSQHHAIDWKIGLLCSFGGIIGGVLGAKILKKVSSKWLHLLFIIFLTYASVRLIF